MSEDAWSDYVRYAPPRCYTCGSRHHTHLRCPGVEPVEPGPALVPTGTMLIDFGEVEQ